MRVSQSISQADNIPLQPKNDKRLSSVSSDPFKVKKIIEKYNKRISTFLRSNVKVTDTSTSKNSLS
jgi:hypothetical protein